MSNERIETYEEDIAELRDTHFDTRLDERVATATMFNRLLDELKRCYEELDRAQCFIQQGWVKFESYTDDGKDLFVDMEDDDGNRFSGWINRAQASE